MRRERRELAAAEKRPLTSSAGLIVTRYQPGGERAEIKQLAAESPERRVDLICWINSGTVANEEVFKACIFDGRNYDPGDAYTLRALRDRPH